MIRLSLLALVVLHACTALAWVFPLTLSRFRAELSTGESRIRGKCIVIGEIVVVNGPGLVVGMLVLA